jgi:predicted dehydrogenase
MRKLSVGIIGYGRLGKGRSKDIQTNENYNLKCKADIIENVEYKNYKDMIKNENLDIVYICVPHTSLKDIAIDCINNGLHVFCEKPPGISLQETKQIYEAHKNNMDRKLAFGFNHRFHNHIKMALKEIKNNDKYGDILWMKGVYGKSQLETWRTNEQLAGRGILLSQGIHMVDIMRQLLKSAPFTKEEEFIDVKSSVSHFNKKWYDDNVFCLLSSKTTTASLHSSCVMWKNKFELDIGLTNGTIKVDGLFTSTKSFGFPERLLLTTKEGDFYGNPTEEIHYFGKDTSFREETDQFVKYIETGQSGGLGTIEDSIEIMKIIEKIYGDD